MPGRGVLFLCTRNSCRSQMAEGLLRHLAPQIPAYSAGTRPHEVNPHAVAAMREINIDISTQESKGLEAVALADIGLVVTLCDDAAQECQSLPGQIERRHWAVDNPAAVVGDTQTVTAAFRQARHQLHRHIRSLIAELQSTASRR